MKSFKNHIIENAWAFHEEHGIPIMENIFRPLTQEWTQFFRSARQKMYEGAYTPSEWEKDLLMTDIGEWGFFDGMSVPLDIPLEEPITEEEKVELNKPKAGGPKKWYVYVKDPNTGNVKKITFGDTTGLKVKINDPEARKNFAARHNCSEKKDKTKPGYWACNLPKYAASLGLKVDNPGAYW